MGIAADEPIRLARLKTNQISLLAKYNLTENDAQACVRALQAEIPNAAQIGYVTELHENYLILE